MIIPADLTRTVLQLFVGGVASMAPRVAERARGAMWRAGAGGASIKGYARECGIVVHTLTELQIANSGASNAAELIAALPCMPSFALASGAFNDTHKDALQAIANAYSLVLLDGRRKHGQRFDLGKIGLDELAHVEIVNEGAATLFGVEAQGGAVNLIRKKRSTDAG